MVGDGSNTVIAAGVESIRACMKPIPLGNPLREKKGLVERASPGLGEVRRIICEAGLKGRNVLCDVVYPGVQRASTFALAAQKIVFVDAFLIVCFL